MRPVEPARSRIVLLGTPSYDDSALPDVPVVANNIADLAAVFTDPGLGGFARDHCVMVPARATTSQVGDLLVKAAEEAEDLLLFYYAGHGLLSQRRRELYLSLAGTRPGARVEFTALPFEAVRNACLESRAANRAVILDSCFSGRAIGETLAGGEQDVLGQIQVAGTYTLTSAPANRTALILSGERHTAFTERMLALLRDGIPSAGPMLSFRDIHGSLYARLRAEGLPAPQQCGTETADRLGLVRNRAAEAKIHAAPTPPPTQASQPKPAADTATSFASGLADGWSRGRTVYESRKSQRRAFSFAPDAPAAQSSADFVVSPDGTVDATQARTDGAGQQDEALYDPLPAKGSLDHVLMGFWLMKRAVATTASASAYLLSLVNVGLALWVLFGPASDLWLWLLIPGAGFAFAQGASISAAMLSSTSTAAYLFALLANGACVAGSVLIAAHRQVEPLSPGIVIVLECAMLPLMGYLAMRSTGLPSTPLGERSAGEDKAQPKPG